MDAHQPRIRPAFHRPTRARFAAAAAIVVVAKGQHAEHREIVAGRGHARDDGGVPATWQIDVELGLTESGQEFTDAIVAVTS
ncbi:MAG TPA: hypothetical protein VGI58_18940 [Streptosporangiaceae bacterium]